MIDGREAVILKEGRRYAGYTRDGDDGYSRVRYEARILRRLDGSVPAPRVLWESDLSGHYMVLMSALPGTTLQQWMVQRMPVYSLNGADWQEYALACEDVIGRLSAAVDGIAAAGLTHGDIHPQNILVDPETLEIGLVDFETATAYGSTPTREINAPGYRIPSDLAPEHLDRFAITKVITDILTGTVEHEDITTEQYNGALPALLDRLAAENGAVPPALRRLVARRTQLLESFGIAGEVVDPPARGHFIDRLRADLPTILTAARSRLGHRPTHFDAFEDDLSGLGLGLAGHALALDTADHPSLIADIMSEARHTDRVGLFDGLCGSVYSLLALGAESEAATLLEGRDLLNDALGPRIFDGVAGILLAALESEAHPTVAKLLSGDLERDIGDFARRYLAEPERFRTAHDLRTNNLTLQRSGLMYGDLGYGWLFAAAHRRFGDPLFAEAMNSAMRAELRGYALHPSGGLQYQDSGRLLPYLATGSAGFGVVLQSVERDLLDPGVAAALADLLTACTPAFSVGCGLFNGYAGLFYGANGLRRFMGLDETPLTELDAAVGGLGVRTSFKAWAVPGDGNFRLTTDLATGSSGIIHAANMIAAGDYRLLPPLQT
ncbi:protein kinase/lanthionine synthetase C family protein [Nocardia sp. NPDC003345]